MNFPLIVSGFFLESMKEIPMLEGLEGVTRKILKWKPHEFRQAGSFGTLDSIVNNMRLK